MLKLTLGRRSRFAIAIYLRNLLYVCERGTTLMLMASSNPWGWQRGPAGREKVFCAAPILAFLVLFSLDHFFLIRAAIPTPAAATAFPAKAPALATVTIGPIPIKTFGAPTAPAAAMMGGTCTSKLCRTSYPP